MIILVFLCFICVGCDLESKQLSYARLEIYTSSDVNISLKHAIYDIDQELSKIMLTDYQVLNQEKVIDFCNSVLIKWRVEASISVDIFKELKTIKIRIGGDDATCLYREKNIMQPLN